MIQLKKYYKEAEVEWRQILKIHEKFKNLSSDLQEDYNERIVFITEVKNNINKFVEKLFPELIENQFCLNLLKYI